ncbi:MAG: sodium:proton antiporter [Ectothiorhodospiraceae bacterium]
MGLLDLAAVVVTLTALFAYINHRFIGLPTTLGAMALSLAVSLALLLLGRLAFPGVERWASTALERIDFSRAVLDGMLSFLLFAGALFVNLGDLAQRRFVVAGLATIGLLTSTALVGVLAWTVFGLLGHPLPFVWCLVFGALISPTDPVAVLGVLKSAGVPKTLETKIVGESLFNDGVAVVVFLVLLETATGGDAGMAHIASLFAREALGGALFGLALGWFVHRLLSSIDQYQVEVLITLAAVMGGYALALALHLSGPIAMVVAGLLLGNHRRERAMSVTTRQHLDQFWELVDEILNAVLFVLIGLEVLVLRFGGVELAAGVLLIPAVLLARLVSVSVPVALLRPFRRFGPGTIRILTWGGLRGGISVALALSLPPGEARELLLPATYCIVVFSLLVQGLTVGGAARRLATTGAD